MSGQPTQEWQALDRPVRSGGQPTKEIEALRKRLEEIIARSTEPSLEGVWLDQTGKNEPVFIDAAEARRKAGLPDVPGRRVIGSGVD